MSATIIKRLSGLDAQNLPEAVLNSSEPLLLEGLCQAWPLVQAGLKSNQAAAEQLQTYYADKPVHACYGEPDIDGRIFYNQDVSGFNFKGTNMPLGPVLKQMLAVEHEPTPPTIYIPSTEVNNWFPTVLEQHGCHIPGTQPLTSLWIGNKTRIAAHYDFPTNIACNLVGKRKFTLFPPSQISNLYVGPRNHAPGGQPISMIDFANPDFERFPRFKIALEHAVAVELEPGDALLLPSMWWHHVEALSSFNVLMSHWWRNSPGFYGRPDNALDAAILAIRSLPKAQRLAWKQVFDHYIFNDELDPLDQIPEQAKAELTLPLDEMSARKLRADLQNKLKR